MNPALERSALVDAAGVPHVPVSDDTTPRIVSLVPSLTELLCDLGLAQALVGRTGFCVHPRETVRRITKVGGTKTVRLERLRELAPTHVVVNVDENEKATVEQIAQFVPHIIVTHPLHPRDNVALYRLFGGIFRREAQAQALIVRFEEAWRDATREASVLGRESVLYLVWRKPWMTVARNTYISAMLATFGWDTVPESAAVRYPEIALDEVLAGDLRHLLLSSEPYPFRKRDVAELRRTAPSHVTVTLIDAEMTSWYGSRAIAGLRYMAELRRAVAAVGTV